MKSSKRRIISHLKNIHYDYLDYSEKLISKDFDLALEYFKTGNYEEDKFHDLFVDDILEGIFDGIFLGVYKSLEYQKVFSTSLNIKQRKELKNPIKIIEDIYYIAKTKLTDEIIYLPNPKSLTDVIEVRKSKDMARFREVLNQWIICLQSGDDVLEKKMRKDIKKANKELRRMKSVQEYKNSPINFWLNSIGGHIPVLSNILTVSNMVIGLHEKWTNKNFNWILLAKR